jgi:lysophospholipid acyltransferase (LPLAT)-like uncharacterized protein
MTTLQQHLVRMATRVLRLYMRTWRVKVKYDQGRMGLPGDHRFGPDLYAVRERDLVAAGCLWRHASFQTMIAQGRDGDWASIVAEGLRCRFVRGSSRHDPAAAAMAFVRALRGTSDPAFLVVDGPLGPSGVAKEGVGAIARLTGRRIVPVAAEAWPRLVLRRSWSRMVIPLPFARLTISMASPIEVPDDGERETLARVASRVSAHFRREAEGPAPAVVAHG